MHLTQSATDIGVMYMRKSGTSFLSEESSAAWVAMLEQFKEKATTTSQRTFRLTSELVISMSGREPIVLPQGSKVTLFCFMSGSYKKTKHTFRVEGSFFLDDCVVSISGRYGNEPASLKGLGRRTVTVTLYDDMRRIDFVPPLQHLVNV